MDKEEDLTRYNEGSQAYRQGWCDYLFTHLTGVPQNCPFQDCSQDSTDWLAGYTAANVEDIAAVQAHFSKGRRR